MTVFGDGSLSSGRATVTVDLAKVRENARTVVDALAPRSVIGVTKVTAGSPEIARAMLAGGVTAIGESRLENIERLRAAGIDTTYWLLRAPTPVLAEQTVHLAEVSLESEVETIRALDSAAARLGVRHSVLVMVDVGDLREGLLPNEVPEFLDVVSRLEHVDILGLGTSLTCYGSVVPSARNLGLLAELASGAERQLGRRLMVSGGSSTSIELVASGGAPASVDNLRIGEAIVLGVDPASRERILGLHTDAVTVSVPVIECKVKPSVPTGELAQDAFGDRPEFEDRGERLRAIAALGRQDAPPGGLRPVDDRVLVLGASSDHLVLDVGDLPTPPGIGDSVDFVPGYAATLALFTSPYIAKRYLSGAGPDHEGSA